MYYPYYLGTPFCFGMLLSFRMTVLLRVVLQMLKMDRKNKLTISGFWTLRKVFAGYQLSFLWTNLKDLPK